jgi:hypothetical protein
MQLSEMDLLFVVKLYSKAGGPYCEFSGNCLAVRVFFINLRLGQKLIRDLVFSMPHGIGTKSLVPT